MGAEVERLPESKETIKVDGNDQYVVNGVTYQPLFIDGQVMYKVVKV